jgi:hypothetical protein
MTDRAELYIARLNGAQDDKVVRIDAKQGAKLLGRIEVNLEDFASALMGMGAMPCTFTTEREIGPRTSTR